MPTHFTPVFAPMVGNIVVPDNILDTECSDCSDYSSSIDCDNMHPVTDFSFSGSPPYGYNAPTTSDAFPCGDTFEDEYCDSALSFSLLQECELQNKLHKFNKKRWEPHFYKLGEEVGKGNFGVVKKATVQENVNVPPELKRREIAVKIFSLQFAHDDAMETIVREAENMLKLEHDRIVPLYGISSSLQTKEIHIVMPFYQLGSLKSYITQYVNELKAKDMCLFGLQIAEGMEYLNSKGFVHRDLALRNILVDSHKNVRIADLGLTRGVVKDQDYYYVVNKSSSTGLPTLWYPPEFFLKSKYDKYCDVWSYGVTMYEMWSYGERPYKRYMVEKQPQLIEFLKHRTLDIPTATPPIFGEVMERCWKPKKERWDFTAIVAFLRARFSSRYVVDGDYTYSKREIRSPKVLKHFNFTEPSKDLENRDPDIPCREMTVRRYVTSFSEERVKKLLKLKHRHLIQYVGYSYTEGLVYTAAPIHSLGSLYSWCFNAKSDMFTKKKFFAAQVLQGMLFLHSQNIIHGSLSAHNVWLRDNNCVVIGEAGMVETLKPEQLTKENVVSYPPEVLGKVLEGEEVTVDARTDTWMYGVMLYQMFSPEPPYSESISHLKDESYENAREIGQAICDTLKETISTLCTETLRPVEIKTALMLCFTDQKSRSDLSILRPHFLL